MGWEDDRGVSEVLGAILLFGILVTAVGGYQAFVVPHQNEEIEHGHDMQVNDEFPKIQTAISNAASSGEPRTASLTLGTDYPFRVFSVGMSPTTGNIKTGDAGTISIDDSEFDLAGTCGFDSDPETRSIQYRANYHEYDNAGRFVYENGVSYREVDGNIVVRNEQELIDGDTITLNPLAIGRFDRTSSASEQLRFRPGQTGVSDVPVRAGEEINLTLPTELTESQWETLLEDEMDPSNIEVDPEAGTLTITLKAGANDETYRFRCTPVGVNEQPDQPLQPPRDDQDEAEGFSINPRSGTVFLKNSSITDDTATVTFQNDDDREWTITQARIPFVLANGDPSEAYVDGDTDYTLVIGDSYEPIPTATLGPDETHEMELEFDDSLTNPGDTGNGTGQPQFDPVVVLSLRLESGDSVVFQTYFITDSAV